MPCAILPERTTRCVYFHIIWSMDSIIWDTIFSQNQIDWFSSFLQFNAGKSCFCFSHKYLFSRFLFPFSLTIFTNVSSYAHIPMYTCMVCRSGYIYCTYIYIRHSLNEANFAMNALSKQWEAWNEISAIVLSKTWHNTIQNTRNVYVCLNVWCVQVRMYTIYLYTIHIDNDIQIHSLTHTHSPNINKTFNIWHRHHTIFFLFVCYNIQKPHMTV